MPKSNANLALKGLDEMFSTEESRQEQKREQVQQIPIEELFLSRSIHSRCWTMRLCSARWKAWHSTPLCPGWS